MEQYYQVEDFQEYKDVFKSKGDSIDALVENLNRIISTNEQVCDMYICMSYMYHKNKNIYNQSERLLKSEIAPIIYIYFKFLLLDAEIKDLYYNTIILRLNNLIHKLKKGSSVSMSNLFYTTDDFVQEEPLENIMTEIYEINNNDTILYFMNHTNALNEYTRLDVTKLNNIDYRSDFYVTEGFYEKFTHVYSMFDNIKCIYHLNYYMSNVLEYQSMLNEGETSISSKEDYMRRFYKNTDKFIRLYNYSNNNTTKDLADYDDIPTDKIILNRHPDIIISDSAGRSKYVRKLFNLIFECPMHSNHMFYTPFRNLIDKKYNYKTLYPNDEYKIYECIHIYNISNQIFHKLRTRYKSYFKTKLYGNLDYINYIYNKYKEVNELKELNEYLKHVIDTHHFNKRIKY